MNKSWNNYFLCSIKSINTNRITIKIIPNIVANTLFGTSEQKSSRNMWLEFINLRALEKIHLNFKPITPVIYAFELSLISFHMRKPCTFIQLLFTFHLLSTKTSPSHKSLHKLYWRTRNICNVGIYFPDTPSTIFRSLEK